MKFGFLSVLFCLSASTASAQSLSKMKADADVYYEAGRYSSALELYEQYQAQKPGNPDVQRKIGISSFFTNHLDKAKQFLTAVADQPSSDPSVLFYLAKVHQYELNFKEAIRTYKLFLQKAKPDYPNRRAAVADIKRCAAGLKLAGQPDLALVENLGDKVNSANDEFGPVQSPNFEDRIYFSSSREASEGGLRTEVGAKDEVKGHYYSDIFYTDVESGEWTSPTPLNNGLVNTPRHEVVLDFDETGKSMYFFRGLSQFSGEILKDTYMPEQETRSLPEPLQSPLQAEEGDNALYFFRDSILLFASRRPGGYGGLDLYITTLSDGQWSTPQNLGPTINTPYDETTPFLAKDGRTLYFSSNSTRSMGGLDIFKSTFSDTDLKWSEPTNLGKPINSAGDDAYFRLTPDGMKAYFSSNRKDNSFGERDLYVALFKTYQREQGRPSTPLVFNQVEAYRAYIRDNPTSGLVNMDKKPTINEADYQVFDFQSLYYEEDADLTKGLNQRQLNSLVSLLKQYPQLKLILVGNCAEGERPQYDLYFTIKRLEKIQQYLITKGAPKDNIQLKSVGSGYPIARMEVNGQLNPSGEHMNKRVDFYIQNVGDLPIKIQYSEPIVSELMADKVGEQLKKHFKGLTYKIQIASIKCIYEGETISKYAGGMIESSPTLDGVYQYSVGLYDDFNSAEKMRQEILKEGAKDVFIVPYINGIRILGDEKKYSTRYSDLISFLAAKNKKK